MQLIGFERAVPVTHGHIDRSRLNAAFTRIANKLRGRIEAHRLTVDDAGGELGGCMTLESCRCIGK